MTCHDCSAPPAPGRARCDRHLAARRESARKFLAQNATRVNEARAVAYAAKPIAARRNANMVARYGISIAEYMELHGQQGGRCAICLKPETSLGNHGEIKNLSIDHDHITGEVRGLLCNNCNRSIGLMKDDPFVLARAFEYLLAGVMA